MIVYRVENKAGLGPYCSDWFGQNWICNSHDFADHTPNAINDVLGFEDGMLCGFNHLKDLETWFRGWLDLLIFAGFRVVEYNVIGIIEGDCQICFISISQLDKF